MSKRERRIAPACCIFTLFVFPQNQITQDDLLYIGNVNRARPPGIQADYTIFIAGAQRTIGNHTAAVGKDDPRVHTDAVSVSYTHLTLPTILLV